MDNLPIGAREEWYQNLSLANYSKGSKPLRIRSMPNGEEGFSTPPDQRVLRMLVRRPGQEYMLPPELKWLDGPLRIAIASQQSFGLYKDRFIYVTVRIGKVITKTDDVWHVDGFSMRQAQLPEQNYVWCDHTPTEYLDQVIPLPDKFDPSVHNIHTFFQDHANYSEVRSLEAEAMYLIDPYFIHRRPPLIHRSVRRAFFRISFIQVEIEDDTCQQNPLLPSGPYHREDIRKTLIRYTEASVINN